MPDLGSLPPATGVRTWDGGISGEAHLALARTLEKLLEGVQRAPYDVLPSTLIFPELSADKLKKDLRLVERGKERGEGGRPPDTATALDDIEHEIIEAVESQKKHAHEQVIDHLNTYTERLHGLDLEGRFSTIQTHGREGISDFRAEVEKGLDELGLWARKVRELEQDMANFQADHGLRRGAYYPSSAIKFLLFGIIAVIGLLEIVANGYFLAKGSEFGLIGGIAEAVTIAFLNIGAAMFIARYGVIQLVHRSKWRKAAGVVAMLIYIAFAIGFNLLVAHYREAAGAFLTGGGQEAVRSFSESPLGLMEFQSWVLFGIGLLFSLIAFVDALFLDDSYPGYGRLHRRREVAHEDYVDEKINLIETLTELKDQTIAAMHAAKDDLGKRRAEYASILDARTRLLKRFGSHLDHLERVGNALLATYREANQEKRGDDKPVPKHFSQSWKLERPADEGPMTDIWPQKKLASEITKAQVSLAKMIEDVLGEYDKAVTSYGKLEDLRDKADAAPAQAAQ